MKVTDNDILFMRRAIKLSQQAIEESSGPPFGAVIAKNGSLIAEGFNHVHSANDASAHAEIVAIRNAGSNLGTPFLDGCVIYSSSEPCPMCMSAIYWSRIERVWIATDRVQAALAGFDDDVLYNELRKNVSERSIPIERIISDEGQTTFDRWKARGLIAVQTKLII